MISFWQRLLNLMAPEACAVCGARLSAEEKVMCASCNLHLPRTGFSAHAYDNLMARRFWGRIPIERAAALFYYEAGSEVSEIIRRLKYRDRPEIGTVMGHMAAEEFAIDGFFDGVDAIIPIPLERKRQHQRGYNQSMEIARGVAEVTHLPILAHVVRRKSFAGSQTHKSLRERMENVEGVFEAVDASGIEGRHLLFIDDIVTSGATVCSCVETLTALHDIKVSVMSLGVVR